ncbi:lipase member I isoform X2 [Tachyglossus aculeatus]|uniref:lipase member I isoform X2 n=1 Tax=Tachyglossus aculeatus TaxID=9261 RepID=UPI0018F6F28D|nr:lipase member I isoform X2 [Tachyglossus aculeatus]
MLRLCLFFSLIPWTKSVAEKKCLEFTDLNVSDAIADLFNPSLDVKMLLYTREFRNCAEAVFQPNSTLNVRFAHVKKTVMIVHGYRGEGKKPQWLPTMVSLLLKADDINVIVVDWVRGATTLYYPHAVKNTKQVASILVEHILNLKTQGVSLDNIHMIGLSLGAHICGFVGESLNGSLGRISGLDPAGPQFTGKPADERLDRTDAKFVDVIHTDTDALGFRNPMGHIDFYPNGGSKQPGCPKTIFSGSSFFKCDHQRSVFLFLSSLEGKCNLTACPCSSQRAFRNGQCVNYEVFKPLPCPQLGYYVDKWKNYTSENGTTIYFDTNKDPFCMYTFIVDISIWSKTRGKGYFKIKLIDKNGEKEETKIKGDYVTLEKFQQIRLFAGFYRDFKDISKISMTYFQKGGSSCINKVYQLKVQSLTNPERPPLCRYDFILKENVETTLKLISCQKVKIKRK